MKGVVYLVVGGVVLANNLFDKAVEALINAHKLFHCCAGQKLENRDEICRISTAHHLAKLITEVHQAEKLLVVVVITSPEAHPTDHISHRDHDVAERVEAAVCLHDMVELFDQVLSLFANVLLKHARVLWGCSLQGGERAQGAVGQLSASTPDACLVAAEGQTFTVIDEAEAVQVRSACKLISLLDKSLSHCFIAAQHNHRAHADLDLEDMAVSLAHCTETQVGFAAQLQHIPNNRQWLWPREPTKPFRNLSAEELENQIDQTHCCQGHQTL